MTHGTLVYWGAASGKDIMQATRQVVTSVTDLENSGPGPSSSSSRHCNVCRRKSTRSGLRKYAASLSFLFSRCVHVPHLQRESKCSILGCQLCLMLLT